MKLSFRALTTNVEVDLEDALPFAALARALVSTYPAADGDAELMYRLRTGVLSRNEAGDRLAEDPRDLVPIFELDLYEQAIARAAPGWILHAAAVAVGNQALVLAGPSGAGKTTLALALMRRGHRLLTEEVVWLGADGMTCGLSRPLHVRDDFEPPPGWTRMSYPVRLPTGISTEHTLAIPAVAALEHGALPIRALVRLTHGPDREPRLARLEPSDALGRFWDPTLRPDDAGLAAATSILRVTPAFRLSSKTFAEAETLIEALTAPKLAGS